MARKKIQPEGSLAPILIWPWRDAPEEYQVLSTRGGREDWVAFVPPEYGALRLEWAEQGTPFARKHLESCRVAGGGRILIGSRQAKP